MNFHLIDKQNWNRTPYFNQFMNNTRCTYSMTANIDITDLLSTLKTKRMKLFPALIYMASKIVNKHVEFRTCFNTEGEVGYFDKMHPLYTIFHKDTQTFSNMWTEYGASFSDFHHRYLQDIKQYSCKHEIIAKPNPPTNTICISCIPWVSFTAFNLNIFDESTYLLPIFTYGKYFRQGDKILLPLSIQVHHAVCDGFHISRFINELQDLAYKFY